MKPTDIAILLGVGVVGYGFIKSSGFGSVSSGVGDAVEGVGKGVRGLGEGVGFAGQAMGYNLADIFDAFGMAGQQSQLIVKEGGQFVKETVHTLRDTQKELGKDVVGIVDFAGDMPRDIAEMGSTWTGTLKNVSGGMAGAVDDAFNLDNPKNIVSTVGGGIGNIFAWVKKQLPVYDDKIYDDKSLKSPITASVISPTTTSYSSYNVSSGSGSVRVPVADAGTITLSAPSGMSPSEAIDSGVNPALPEGVKLGDVIVPTPAPEEDAWWKFW